MSKEYTRTQSILGNIPEHGQIIAYDDMEGLLKWFKTGTGGDDTLDLSPTRAYHGSQSLFLKTRITDAAEDDTILANRAVYLLPSQKINTTYLFHCSSWLTMKTVSFLFNLYNGTKVLSAGLAYDALNTKLQIFDQTLAWTDIPNGVFPLEDISPANVNTWHIISFAADFSAPKYGDMFLNQNYLDLSAFTPKLVDNASLPHLDTHCSISTRGAAPTELYIDSFLANEL